MVVYSLHYISNLLYPGGDRRGEFAPGGGYSRDHEPGRRLWDSGAGLCGGECQHKGGKDHPELYWSCE